MLRRYCERFILMITVRQIICGMPRAFNPAHNGNLCKREITIRSAVRRCGLNPLNGANYFPLVDRLRRVTILRAAAIGGIAAALSLTVAPGAYSAVQANSATARVAGLDISAYQHAGSPINWGLLAADGLRFVAIKVSEGTYYVNPYYSSDARAAAKSGLAVLPYVFANPSRANGRATASYAVRAAGSARGRLPFVIDLEDDPYRRGDNCYGLKVPAMIAWITGFTSAAEALTGQFPVIYTTADWWDQCTGDTAKFRRAPLWLAAFKGTPPTAPSPWPRWTFLQYNNNGTLPSLGQVDLDYFHPTTNFPALSPAKPKKPKPKKPKPTTSHRAKPKPTQKPRKSSTKPASRPKTVISPQRTSGSSGTAIEIRRLAKAPK
jgi:GH25 family lysozyme M1 (1,4-beta-N-acetylmuramidase)